MSETIQLPPIGKSHFEETGVTAIESYVTQVTKACEKSGEPLPETVKNYRPGDTVLYKNNEAMDDDDKYQLELF